MQDKSLKEVSDTIRIPVYGEERFIPDSLSGFDMEQNFINCYPEITIDPVTGEKSTGIIKRPGTLGIMSIKTAVGAANATDVHVKAHIVITQLVDVFIVAAFDTVRNKTYIVQYRPVTNTSTLIGDLGTTAWIDPVHITEYQQVNSGVLYPAIGVTWKKADESVSRCYSARSDGTVFTGSSLTQITQVGFPDQQTPAKVCTGPFQQMNGLVYIMCTDGSIYNSGGTAGTPNDITTAAMWNTLSVIQTYQSPDKGIGIFRYKHHLLAFGKDSIEFFNDIGNPPPASSLERTEQAYIKFGTPTSKSILNVADTIYWIAYGSNNTMGLWKMDGYAPVKVSRARQDFHITNGYHTSSNTNTIDLISMMINGKMHIGINNVQEYNMIWRQTTYGDQTNDTYKDYQTKWRGIAGSLFYNSSDDLWWSWSAMGDYTCRIVPATAYPSTATGTIAYQYTQYLFYDNNPLVTTGQTITVSSDYVFKLGENDQYNFYTMADDAQGSFIPVHAAIQFNTLDFENSKRNRIDKLTLVFRHTPLLNTHTAPTPGPNESTDSGTYSISLIYRKGNYTSSITQNVERYIAYPQTSGRYYFNNLGTARQFSFCITALSRDSFDLEAIELNVRQGTH